tara:strand:- start:591 stop:1196 length:606 start_codon:yes stop_codon:yes gene_type:complete
MDKIIILGSGGHAKSCAEVIESTGKYEIAGYIHNEDNSKLKDDIRFLGNDTILKDLRYKVSNAFIGIGQIKSPEKRINLYTKLIEIGYNMPTIISPNAYVSKSAEIGEGTIIMHQAIVNCNSKIGDNCIVNSKALIEHDVVIGNHCHISTGSIVNGNCTIKDEVFIGSGAICKHGVTIEQKVVINAGKYIHSNINSNSFLK